MGVEEKILDYQLSRCLFDNAEFEGTHGIARRAVEMGFNTLSPKQKAVLQPYLYEYCSGVTDPGGHHNNCSAKLEGEDLLEAYERCDDPEILICNSCYSEEGYHTHRLEKLLKE
ncbi:hypothetical protein [Halomonas phage vB_HmeY_H4907]|nr:hypothetical protein [Halomonas phage vB_HmeY_H4907]